MYKVYYKCRFCGELFHTEGGESYVMNSTLTVMKNGVASIHSDIYYEPYETHDCEKGMCGVGDFIGVKRQLCVHCGSQFRREGKRFVCEKRCPHPDGDYSYLCGSDYCKCCQ